MTVEGEHEQALGVAGETDAGDVAVGIKGQLHLLDAMALDVIGVYRDLGVLLAGDGIFIGVGSRVVGIFVKRRVRAFVEREGELLHGTLVVAYPRQHGAIGIEVEGAGEREFLLVDPVGLAVDNLVELAVLCHLALGIAEEELDEEEVALAHEGHHRAVGREGGHLLRSAVAEALERAVLHIIYIIYGREGVAVDAVRLCLDQDGLLVGTHDIAVDAVEAHASGRGYIEEHIRLLARLEEACDDLAGIGRELAVALAVVEGIHAMNSLGGIHPVREVFQGQFTCHRRQQTGTKGHKEESDSFHIFSFSV